MRCLTIGVAGLIIIFIYEWMMGFVIIGFVILFLIVIKAKSSLYQYLVINMEKLKAKTAGMIEESLVNIRTINSMNMQLYFIQRYNEQLKIFSESGFKIGIINGILNGFN